MKAKPNLPSDYPEELIPRYIQACTQLLNNHLFWEESEVREILGTELEPLLKQKKILFVDNGNLTIYPTFQFDKQRRAVNPILGKWLPILFSQRGGWDICIWLTTVRASMTRRAMVDPQIFIDSAWIGRAVRDYWVGLETDFSEWAQATPIELIQNQNAQLFDMFITDWLEPDQREIETNLFTPLDVDITELL